ncbi:Uma2 family endonuclease [bacterium]|nr:Uma2 family endonuclease [bacterium]
MSTAEATTLITADELFARGSSERAELIRGELVEMSPAGSIHGEVASLIHLALGAFVVQHKLGKTLIAEAGFLIERNPDTVRVPDVAFVAGIDSPQRMPEGFFDGPPTISVEVVSPSDRQSHVMQKVNQWLNAGCQSVWLIDPQREKVTICRLVDGQLQTTDTDQIVEPELLPGFALDTKSLWQR